MAVTVELKQWIETQTAAGFGADALFKSMCESGWTPEVAQAALNSVLGCGSEANVQALPAGQARSRTGPQPDLQGSPRELDLGDRVVDVLLSLQLPKLVVLGRFLSDEECDALVAMAQPRMARSLTVDVTTGGEEINPSRTSRGMFFRRAESEVVTRIEARIARLLHWPVENGEGIQVLHYQPGAEYKPHYDYFNPQEAGTTKIIQRGGQRRATLVMYLNNPVRGGGTTFPDVGLEVAPQKGNAVFFAYECPDPVTKSLHGGAPVLEGEKWVATKWLREREFT